MARGIEPKEQKIGEYLKLDENEKFVIPEYQRAYSWSKDDCDKLWQSFVSFCESPIENEEPYFLGTIITDRSEKHPGEVHIIDGQQRTITFLLLAKCFQLKLQEQLAKLPPDDEDFIALKNALEHSLHIILSIFTKKMDFDEFHKIMNGKSQIETFNFIVSRSINEQHAGDFETLFRINDYAELPNNINIKKKNIHSNYFINFKNFYEEKIKDLEQSQLKKYAETFLDKCQIIEIRSWQFEQAIQMFNSLNSTGMPLADADILSAEMYSKASCEKELFMDKWKELVELCSHLEKNKIVSIDNIFQQRMYIERSRDGLKDVTITSVRKYFTGEKKYYLLERPIVFCDELLDLANAWNEIKDYPLVRILLKFNENAKIFLGSFLSRFKCNEIQYHKEDVLQVTKCLLRLFAILELVEAGYSSKNFKSFLFGENVCLVKKDYSVEDVSKEFYLHIKDIINAAKIEDYVKNYNGSTLVFLNEWLYAKEQSREQEFDFDNSVNIEHIMPSSGQNKKSIQEMAGIKKDGEFKELVNQLGNKILLEEKINKDLHDDWFRQKKSKTINEKRGYKNSKYPLAQSLVDYPSDHWTKDDIRKATEKAACRIARFVEEKGNPLWSSALF